MILAHCLDGRMPYVCNGFLEQVLEIDIASAKRRCGKIGRLPGPTSDPRHNGVEQAKFDAAYGVWCYCRRSCVWKQAL